MKPSETQEDLIEPASPGIEDGNGDCEAHQGLKINRNRRVEIHRLKFRNVPQLIRIEDVQDHVLVQMPAIGIHEGSGEAGGKTDEPRLNTGKKSASNRGIF